VPFLFNIPKTLSFWVAPLVALLILLFFNLDPEHPETTAALAVAALMAVWWVTEAIPLAVTALIPVVLFPLLGIMNGRDVSSLYFNHIIFLFIGGFIVALAMQRWNLHTRIALKILLFIGTSQARILLGFMLATAFLSMWISNTATTMMMIPILISVISEVEKQGIRKGKRAYSTGLLLSVAYSASIGGMMTLVGTPPNLSFTRIYQIMFPAAPEISFADWLIFALPAGLVLFIFAWIFLFLRYRDKENKSQIKREHLKKQYLDLGKMGVEEKIILIDFVLLALLWLSRSDIILGQLRIPGWSNLFSNPEYINDGTVAMACSVILFMIPGKAKKKTMLMNWETAKGLPWGIVLLFGGGFALAGGFKESGLSLWMGEQLKFVASYHPIIIIAVIALFMTFLTELTSNTATTEMILPILAGLAIASETHPLLFMLPATMSASMAFMLPVATPPNAIVFGTNRLKIKEMVRTGLVMNLAGIFIITLAVYFIARLVFGFDLETFPEWAKQ
jgi:solute carrier family 13 (sodium-dependent dicarboxylate transporter), member 2/3/5